MIFSYYYCIDIGHPPKIKWEELDFVRGKKSFRVYFAPIVITGCFQWIDQFPKFPFFPISPSLNTSNHNSYN